MISTEHNQEFVWLNDNLIPLDHARVSVNDRGLLYGDGLFETLRVVNGQPFRWAQHLERLQHGADFLKIKLPFAPAALRDFAAEAGVDGLITVDLPPEEDDVLRIPAKAQGIDIVRLASSDSCIVLTGRGATEGLLAIADTVTEMRCVKHGYQKGRKAQKGVEL